MAPTVSPQKTTNYHFPEVYKDANDEKEIFKVPTVPLWRTKKVIIGYKRISEYRSKRYANKFVRENYPERVISKRLIDYAVRLFLDTKIRAAPKTKQHIKICSLCNWPRSRDIIRNLRNFFCDKCAMKMGMLPRCQKGKPKILNHNHKTSNILTRSISVQTII